MDGLFLASMHAGGDTFLPVFMARIGASSLEIGLLTSVPGLAVLFIAIPAGILVQRRGNYVRTVTVYRALYRTAYIALIFLPFFFDELLPAAIVLIWSLSAMPQTVQSLAYISVIGAVIPRERRPRVNGVRWAATGVLSAILATLVGRFLDAPWLSFPLNYQTLFLFTAVAAFVGLLPFSRIRMPADYPTRPEARKSWLEEAKSSLEPVARSRAFMRFLAGLFILQLGMSMPTALFSIFWVHNLNATDTIIGLRTTVGQVSLIASYLVLGRVAARRGYRGLFVASAFGMGIYAAMTALSPNAYWLLPAALVWGFSSGGFGIAFTEAFLDSSSPEARPRFAASRNIVSGITSFGGPLIGAFLMRQLGIHAALYISGALLIAGSAASWGLGIGKRETCSPDEIMIASNSGES